jgi:hypothetical protein
MVYFFKGNFEVGLGYAKGTKVGVTLGEALLLVYEKRISNVN